MIEIRDQQLRLLFLTHLIRELQRSVDENRPAPPGLTEAQYAELRSLSSDDLVRLSVGLEDPDDLFADLDRALRSAR